MIVPIVLSIKIVVSAMILSAVDLQKEITQGTLKIEPLSKDTIRENGIDLRVSESVMRLRECENVLEIQSPKCEEFYLKENIADTLVLGKFEKVLVATLERVSLPNNLMAFCQLRSTFSRAWYFHSSNSRRCWLCR